MFKGLRAKIESEQRGQAGSISSNNNNQSISQPRRLQDSQGETRDRAPTKDDTAVPSNCSQISISQTIPELLRGDLVDRVPTRQQETISPTNNGEDSINATPTNQQTTDAQRKDKDYINDLEDRISSLEVKLSTVIREKEEISDQNSQLYQLIEKLRRNLETESETRTSLQARLDELTKQLTDKAEAGVQRAKNDIALNRSFNPVAPAPDPNIPYDVEALRNEVTELQAQLALKNRQLKICQQNLTDLKKTLQKEILDHSNAQRELSRLQEQLKAPDQIEAKGRQNHSREKSSITTTQNGFNN